MSIHRFIDDYYVPTPVKTIVDGELVDVYSDNVFISIHDRAFQFLVEHDEFLKQEECKDLRGCLIVLSDLELCKNIDVGDEYDLRRLIMIALRAKHMRLASFMYGVFVRDTL